MARLRGKDEASSMIQDCIRIANTTLSYKLSSKLNLHLHSCYLQKKKKE